MSAKSKGKATARLAKEVQMITDNPPPGVIDIHFKDSDMHSLHFAIAGPEDTSFAGGVYVLKIQLPQDYPYSPPDFIMLTPNGRFQVGAKIYEDAPAQGMVHMSVAQRKDYAAKSVAWGARSAHKSTLKIFNHLIPGLQTKASLDAAVAELTGRPALPSVATSGEVRAGKRSRQEAEVNAAPSEAHQRQRCAAPVNLSTSAPAIGYKSAAGNGATGTIDLTDGQPQQSHGEPGAIKRARAAARAQVAALAGTGEGSKMVQVASVSADVVDLT